MRLSVLAPSYPEDGRVAATPDTVRSLTARGVDVVIESGAGTRAGFEDDAYAVAGAQIVPSAAVLEDAEVVAVVGLPPLERVEELPTGSILIGLLRPVHEAQMAARLADRGITAFAMELIPRISRAQAMDALSSQAGIAGYKTVLLAANTLDKLFPLSMTAAGTIRPANVIVLGAGVAGLQAIATARRLGARVQANDVRAAAADEVASLGAEFIHIPGVTDQTGEGGYAKVLGEELAAAQQRALEPHLAKADAVICTAQIPGRRAPLLLPAEAVEAMPPGSVVVDLPAEDGGNCALTELERIVEHHGVRIIPAPQLARTLPQEASALYARNVANLVALVIDDDGHLHLDLDDEVVAGTLYVHDRQVVHAPTAAVLAAADGPETA